MSKYYPKIESNTFVYKIICPIRNEVKYIGQTSRGIKRFYEHITDRNKKYPLYRWILKLYKKGIRPIFEVIEYCEYDKLNEIEIKLVSLYENLYNLTEGGTYNLISENHNSIFLKGKTLESYYGEEKANDIKKRTSENLKGEKNPNYKGKTIDSEWRKNQSISQSKKPLRIVNSITNEEYIFTNSFDAAKFINCNPIKVREYKRTGWRVNKIWYIYDHLNITT